MRQSTIRRFTSNASHKDFFGINNITSKDVAGAFSSGTKLSTGDIEKKYNPLMGARIRLLNEEKEKNALFGRIRKDSDNVISKHGQYELESTERLYDTIQLKQMFVPDDDVKQAQNEPQPTSTHRQDNTCSRPNSKPDYNISEVEPEAKIEHVLKIFKRKHDDHKMSAFKYKNKPPLQFCFTSTSQTTHESVSHTEELNQSTPSPASPEQHEQKNSREGTEVPSIRRPMVDIDNEAGPEGARAPLHELDRLSWEYAQRQDELFEKEVKFDRSIDREFDVKDDEPQKPLRAIDHIKKVRSKEIEPIANKLKQTIETKERILPLRPSMKLDSRGFRNYALQVPDWTKVRRTDVIGYLRGSIIYHNYDILAINKPYGIASHANSNGLKSEYDVDTLVHEIAKSMRIERVFLAHRLDKTTTGVLLFATSQERAQNLNKLFKADEIKKTYVCITKNVPDPRQGVIDMPIGEIEVSGKLRSCPAPYDLDEEKQLAKRCREARRAITEYRVLDDKTHVALVELKPQTGVKHQLRCHMSFGLNTPILGDHKYSHLHKLAPQTLAPPVLKTLHLRQAKVRTLPMHLHAHSIVIPGAKANGETLFIHAPLPQHFIDNMKTLKLSMPH
jgi:23S rRNA-/tRNA-specific pseudouridylate synthase